jgi:hypothetical protein
MKLEVVNKSLKALVDGFLGGDLGDYAPCTSVLPHAAI